MSNLKQKLSGIGIGQNKGKGKVLVVTSYKDFPKIKGGEIVVTKNATPDFILILNKISCLITDEGCVTSHIAIICRELSASAIIGTGKASTILKNSQEVDYNSTNGTIYY